MKITWYGLSCIYLEGKSAKVLMDPFDHNCGRHVVPAVYADLYTVSHEHYDHNYREAVTNSDAVRARYGMLEKGVRVSSIHSWHDKSMGMDFGPNEVFILDLDGLRIVHLGDLGLPLDTAQLAALGHVDVLIIPVGGIYTIDAAEAAAVANAVDARLTIPVHYHSPLLEGADFALEDGVDPFIEKSARKAVRLPGNQLDLDKDAFPDHGIAVFHLA